MQHPKLGELLCSFTFRETMTSGGPMAVAQTIITRPGA